MCDTRPMQITYHMILLFECAYHVHLFIFFFYLYSLLRFFFRFSFVYPILFLPFHPNVFFLSKIHICLPFSQKNAQKKASEQSNETKIIINKRQSTSVIVVAIVVSSTFNFCPWNTRCINCQKTSRR